MVGLFSHTVGSLLTHFSFCESLLRVIHVLHLARVHCFLVEVQKAARRLHAVVEREGVGVGGQGHRYAVQQVRTQLRLLRVEGGDEQRFARVAHLFFFIERRGEGRCSNFFFYLFIYK
jgi:hypothetical protein